MNKLMAILGMMLVFGLSFAQGGWMEQVEGRYVCSFIYNEELYGIAWNIYDGGTAPQCDEDTVSGMYYDLYLYTQPPNMYSSVEEMYYAAGCERDGVVNPLQEFRAGMQAYNSVAADFRMGLNRCIRSYIAEGGDREGLIADLNAARGGYQQCLIAGETVCELPPVLG